MYILTLLHPKVTSLDRAELLDTSLVDVGQHRDVGER